MPVSGTPVSRPGFPAIQEPREFLLAPFQQQIRNIRERFKNLEAQLTKISAVVGANTDTQSILSLQSQIAQLSTALEELTIQVSAVSDPVSTALSTDARMRAVAQEAFFMVPAPNDVNSVIANRVFRA